MNLVRMEAALAVMADSLGLALVEEKSIASVARKFHAELRNLCAAGFVSDRSILGEMRKLVRDAVSDAYIQGLDEGGVPVDEMGDDDALMIVELAQTQLEHVTDFVRAIRAAKGDSPSKDGATAQRDILDNRVAMWTASIEAAGQAGLASAKANEMVVFAVKPGADPSDESCKTCVRLLGQKHRRKWVVAHGLIPAPGNNKFECGAWRCPHAWIPVK